MTEWNGIPGGGLPAGAASSMTNLGTESNPVWGWAGAERVNSHMAAAMPGLVSREVKSKICQGSQQAIRVREVRSAVTDRAILVHEPRKRLRPRGKELPALCASHPAARCPLTRRRGVPQLKAQPCDEIVERLFLGTKECADSAKELQKRNIELTIGVGNCLKLSGDEVS